MRDEMLEFGYSNQETLTSILELKVALFFVLEFRPV
jgi:hypothetical protein